jgi:NitT/TauT family transport system substrate-binding protein
MKRSTALLTLGAAALPYRASAQTLTKLRIGQPPGTAAAVIMYAQQSGIFHKYGLDVDLQKMGSGSAIISALAGGSLEIGNGSTFAVVTAFAHGLPMQILAGGPIYNSSAAVPYGVIYVAKNSPLKTAADLNGKTIGLSSARGDLNAVATQAWVEQHGGDWSSIRVLELPQEAMVAAIDAGRIDAMTLQSPSTAIAEASGKVRRFGRPYDAVGKQFSIAAWYGTSTWATANAPAVRAYEQAIGEASRYANAHWDAMLPLMAQFSGVDASVLGTAARAPFTDRADPANFQPIIDLEVKYKVIDKSFEAKDFIAPSALKPY